MMATILFSGVAAALVYLAGRKDAARDPRLTGMALALLAVLPLMVRFMPKLQVLPAGEATVAAAGFSWSAVAFGIWLAGFSVAWVRLVVSAGVLVKWHGRSRWIACRGRIEIRELQGLKGPVAAGVFRPVVFVPETWGAWSDGMRRMVLEHELAHHHRRDPLWRWVAEIACAVNWFNPLVWWMMRRFILQCEYSCDARVLRQGVAAADYAVLLCDLAEDSVFRGPAVAMAERPSLEKRVRRLMGKRHAQASAAVTLWIASALAAAAALALIGPRSPEAGRISPGEVRTRWAADPFPGEAEIGL